VIEDIRQLIRWNTWATRQVHGTLRASGGEPAKALAAFQHSLETEVVWLRRFENDTRPMLKLWQTASLETCDAYAAEAAERWKSFAAKLDGHTALERRFTYRNQSGREFTDRLADPLFHTLLHSSQYRGEAAGFLNAAGHTVADLDYILWLRVGAPD
jgi:uncharacterized damage-inducible protein DinB